MEGKGRDDRAREEREGFFTLYLSIRWLQKGPWKFLMGSWKVLDFLSVKEWELWTLSGEFWEDLTWFDNVVISCVLQAEGDGGGGRTEADFHWNSVARWRDQEVPE